MGIQNEQVKQTLQGNSENGTMMKKDWPNYHHSPEDSERAEYYYFDKEGNVIPTPQKARFIATELVKTFYFTPHGEERKPGVKRKLSLLDTTTEPGSKVIFDLARTAAIEECGVAPEDITLVDRSVPAESERLRMLKRLREEGKEEERAKLLEQVAEEEYLSVERVRFDDETSIGGQLTIRDTNPEALDAFDQKDKNDLVAARAKSRQVRMKHLADWMLTGYPTLSTIAVDRKMNPDRTITQEDEVYEWIKACERPRLEVLQAQEKLAQKLNSAYRMRIFAYSDDLQNATDLILSPVKVTEEGEVVPRRWFNHAGYENNFPGSEVYGVPLRDGVFGTIAYPFPVMFDGVMLPNVKLQFKDGKVADWEVTCKSDEDVKAVQHFAQKMNDPEHPGNRFLGEIGIGTSPYPTFNTRDIGFNEKRTGIHIALGMCYDNKEKGDEMGNPTDSNNGNQAYADIHADLVMPSSKTTKLQMWAEIGTPQPDGTVKKEWQLLMHEGAFVEKISEGTYQADPEMQILNSLDADTQPFSASFPKFTSTRRAQ